MRVWPRWRPSWRRSVGTWGSCGGVPSPPKPPLPWDTGEGGFLWWRRNRRWRDVFGEGPANQFAGRCAGQFGHEREAVREFVAGELARAEAAEFRFGNRWVTVPDDGRDGTCAPGLVRYAADARVRDEGVGA
jgi:hypothetical protein